MNTFYRELFSLLSSLNGKFLTSLLSVEPICNLLAPPLVKKAHLCNCISMKEDNSCHLFHQYSSAGEVGWLELPYMAGNSCTCLHNLVALTPSPFSLTFPLKQIQKLNQREKKTNEKSLIICVSFFLYN